MFVESQCYCHLSTSNGIITRLWQGARILDSTSVRVRLSTERRLRRWSIAFLHWLQVCRVLLLILIELVYYYRTNREWIWYKSVKSQNWRYPSFFFGVQPALLQNKLSENGVQRAHAFETFELMARAFLILLWIEILWNSRNWKKYL